MCESPDSLTQFIALVPFNDRKIVTNLILKVRGLFKEQIETNEPFFTFIKYVKELRKLFMHTVISLRLSLKEKLIESMQASVENSEALAVLVLLLCVIELGCVRNQDRSDLETSSILKTVPDVVSIVSSLLAQVQISRCNLLSLRSWSIGILVYTYRTCLTWCAYQDCFDIITNPITTMIPIDNEVINSPSMPKLVCLALVSQQNCTSPPIASHDFSLFDLLLSSAISNSTKSFVKINARGSELVSNLFDDEFDKKCLLPTNVNALDNHINCKNNITLDKLKNSFNDGNAKNVYSHIKILEKKIMDNANATEEFKKMCMETIINSPSLLLNAAHLISSSNSKSAILYTNVFCGIVKIWIFALEKNILKDVTQSYLYLGGLLSPRYMNMPLRAYTQAILLQSQFLTSYLRAFRSSVLASPHWYLQMVVDIVISIIDRLETAANENELTSLEIALYPCIAAISRTWASLHIDDPDIKPQLSRAVKGLLDAIVIRIANASFANSSVNRKRKWKSGESSDNITNIHEKAVLSPKIRHMLNCGILHPILQSIDPWALQQSNIGLKPTTAREVLRKLISTFHSAKQNSLDAPKLFQVPIAHAAVGGLGLRAKVI